MLGDADREGEVLINLVIYRIFDELKESSFFKIRKNITRIWLEDQTKETIQKELKNLRPISQTQNLYNEGLARTYIDWLYGIYLTRYVSLLSHSKYNTGRVIIPTVKYVYDRDMEILNFRPETYYEIGSIINKNNQEIKLNFKELKFKKEEKNIALEKLENLKGKEIKVIDIEEKQTIKKPNKLFSLSSLQNYMSKTKKFSLDKTLSIVQVLYEKNYLTYPRTNTEYMAEEEKSKAQQIINAINRDYLKSNELEFRDTKDIFDSSKVESHSALTPTTNIANINELSSDEQSVYLAVLHRFIANFYKEKCLINTNTVTFMLENMESKIKGTSVLQQGYLKYENNLNEKTIPIFQKGESFIGKFTLEEKETTPPNKVTESELNNFFEKPFRKNLANNDELESDDEDYKKMLKGIEIGTPATRSATVEKVKQVGYITADKNILSITEKGKTFIETLNLLKIDLYKEKTVELSQNLKKVYSGEKSIDEIIKIAEDEIKQIINQKVDTSSINTSVEKEIEIIGQCPICKQNIFEGSKSYYCSSYKEGCKFTIWKTFAGKKLSITNIKDLLTQGATKEIKGFKSKTGRPFNANLVLDNEGKIMFNFCNKK